MPNFIDYDSIADRICYFDNYVLSFVVRLAKKDKDGNRSHYHKEFQYNAPYLNTSQVIAIKRQYDYYYTIERFNLEGGEDKNYIQIRAMNIIMLQNILNNMTTILFNDSNWAIKNKRLILKGQFEPLVLTNLPMDKWISFTPIVYESIDGMFSKGVRMILSDSSQICDMTIDKFMEFTYYITSIPMTVAAQTLLNYLPMEMGTNLVTFDSPYIQQQNENKKYEGVKAPNRISYFDKNNKFKQLED